MAKAVVAARARAAKPSNGGLCIAAVAGDQGQVQSPLTGPGVVGACFVGVLVRVAEDKGRLLVRGVMSILLELDRRAADSTEAEDQRAESQEATVSLCSCDSEARWISACMDTDPGRGRVRGHTDPVGGLLVANAYQDGEGLVAFGQV